jgi:KipI family sensor histidine kinase inhibitor
VTRDVVDRRVVDRRVVDRRVAWFGEAAILVEPLPSEDLHALAEALRLIEGVEDVLPGSVVLVRAGPASVEFVRDALPSIPAERPGARSRRVVEIPVAFDGADLAEIAAAARTGEQGVVEKLAAAELRVAYLGFSPGFPYIVGLPEELTRLGRRKTPRTSVTAGSVGIAAGYLGIYPQASPGGWNLLGRTALAMFDPLVPPYAALRHGDVVRIVPVDSLSAAAASPVAPALAGIDRPRCTSSRRLVVESPGVLTTLQDRGRRGVGHLGVPRAGPVDPDLMQLANLVAGNAPEAGVLETTVCGPVLRFDSPGHVVVVGARFRVDGRELEPGAVVPVDRGGRVDVGESPGLRGYLAVCGGIRGPALFGSCSSDLLSGLGIGPLRSGDELGLGDPGHPRGYAAEIERSRTIRVVGIEGPGGSRADVLDDLIRGRFTVETDSNRIGVRLRGCRPLRSAEESIDGAGQLGSYGMVEGAVQLPPSGQPIVLLCDHATMGGYPVIATVISADIGTLAQKRPGETLQFELVDHDEARRARAMLDRRIARGPVGLYPEVGP